MIRSKSANRIYRQGFLHKKYDLSILKTELKAGNVIHICQYVSMASGQHIR